MNRTNEQIRMVTSRLTRRSWLENVQGKRITPKFKLKFKHECGDFVILDTDKAEYIYHKFLPNIITVAQFASVYSLGPSTYSIYNSNTGYSVYSSDATRINSVKCLDVKYLGLGLIGFKTQYGWGIMKENGEILVNPCNNSRNWDGISHFGNFNYAIVTLKKDEEYAVINERGEYIIDLVKCTNLKPLSDTRLFVYQHNKIGVIDITGTEIVPAIYTSIIPEGDYYIVNMKKVWPLGY